jgi:hypothetical protein
LRQPNWHYLLSFPSSVPLHRVTLSSHWSKTSLMSLLHISVILHLITSLPELKPKHWIRTPTAGHPPRTVWLPTSTAIKDHLNRDYSSHHLITSLFCLFPSQSTTTSKLHLPPSFSFTVVPRTSSLHTMTPSLTTSRPFFDSWLSNNLSTCEFM